MIMKTSTRYFLVAGSLAAIGMVGAILIGLGSVAHGRNRNLRNDVEIQERNSYRYIRANGVPDHQHGRFPNRGNPNRIREQRYDFRLPLNPQVAEKITPLGHQPFGVALNGVPFDPGTAEFWRHDHRSGWNYEALSGKIDLGLDHSHAHVQPNGAYHYHGVPTGLIAEKKGASGRMTLVGYAADGFPIYARLGHADPEDADSDLVEMRPSYRLKRGQRPDGPGGRYDGTYVADYEYVADAGDLDQCNGRFGVTPEYREGTYHYFITGAFPFVPRHFRGTPDDSFARRGPPGPPGFGPPPPGKRGFRPPPPGKRGFGPPPPGKRFDR